MRIESVEIYSDQSNAAVLRHPGRKFPGVLIQGDTLNALCAQASDALGSGPDARGELEGLRDALYSLLGYYKTVLSEHGIALPFVTAADAQQFIQAELASRVGLIQTLGGMGKVPTSVDLKLSLLRGLLGEVHPQLRMASIQPDPFAKTIRLRFEYDGEPIEQAQECCSCAATEVIADFSEPWMLDEQHVACPAPAKCAPLEHLVYWRHEGWDAARQVIQVDAVGAA